MRYTDIQNSPTGYVLRHSRATKLMTHFYSVPST